MQAFFLRIFLIFINIIHASYAFLIDKMAEGGPQSLGVVLVPIDQTRHYRFNE